MGGHKYFVAGDAKVLACSTMGFLDGEKYKTNQIRPDSQVLLLGSRETTNGNDDERASTVACTFTDPSSIQSPRTH